MVRNTQHQQRQHGSRLGVEVLQGYNLIHLTDRQVSEFKKALWEHGVVVVRQQHLTALDLEEFATRSFGSLVFGSSSFTLDPDISPKLQSRCVGILGNPKGFAQEVVEKFTWKWHQDKDAIPRIEGLDMNALYVVMLHGVEVPPEGLDGQPHTTEFLDMVEAYNNLDRQHQQQLEQISLYHTAPMFSAHTNEWGDVPKKVHSIVSTHKVTGKRGLYLGSDTAIPVGMEDRPEAEKHFWKDLFQTVLSCTPVYSHVWHPGDIIFWDNSQVMHRGTPYDSTKYKRIALRLGVVDNIYDR